MGFDDMIEELSRLRKWEEQKGRYSAHKCRQLEGARDKSGFSHI